MDRNLHASVARAKAGVTTNNITLPLSWDDGTSFLPRVSLSVPVSLQWKTCVSAPTYGPSTHDNISENSSPSFSGHWIWQWEFWIEPELAISCNPGASVNVEQHGLTLKALSKIVADDILFYFQLFFRENYLIGRRFTCFIFSGKKRK